MYACTVKKREASNFHGVYNKKSKFDAKVSRFNSENVPGTDEVSRKVSFLCSLMWSKAVPAQQMGFLSIYTVFGMQNIFL